MNNILEQEYVGKAEFIELSGRRAVKTFGDLSKEYEALRKGAMLYDCSNYGIFIIEGEGSDVFLEKLATKDIQYLNIGNISECYFLNEHADVVGNVFILRQDNDFIVFVPWEQGEAVKEWLNLKAQIEGKIKITELNTNVLLAIEGPNSWQVVKNVFAVEIETIALRSSMNVEYNEEKITILRIGRSSEYGYMILSSINTGKMIYNALLAEKEKCDFPIEEGGVDCLELSILEVHQPNFMRETKEFGNVLELEQQWYVQYDKEDYIGYDKLMELFKSEVGKHAVGFVGETGKKAYKSGVNIFVNGNCIGRVVYSIYSIALEKPLGIAVLDNPYAQSGLEFEVNTDEGIQIINTISSPFVRPMSWDLKME